MKKIVLILLVFFAYCTVYGAQRSVIGEIPINNIFGWVGKVKSVYFNPNECEQSYFKIKLTGFDIGANQDKRFWNKYDPFLFIEVDVGAEEPLRKVLSPDEIAKITVDSKPRARSINNQNLFGPFPYRGEDITVTVNLYAYKTKSGLKSALQIANNFSGLFPNQLNTFTKVSGVLEKSMDIILPSCKKLVSYKTTWNPRESRSIVEPNQFKEGYFIIHPLETKSEIDYSKIFIDKLSQIIHKENNIDEHLYKKNIDYVVIEFEHFITRKDKGTFPFYKKYEEAYKKALNPRAFGIGDIKKAIEESEKIFQKAMDLLYSDDNFTFHDKILIHIDLYKKLLVQFENRMSNYIRKVTPKSSCTTPASSSQDIDKALFTNVIREFLITSGLLEPGKVESKEKLLDLIKKLPAKYKEDINKFMVEDYKIETGGVDKLAQSYENILNKEEFLVVTDLDNLTLDETASR